MIVIVNGETQEITEGTTMQQLLKLLQLEGKVMAAAVNMEIVKQNVWDQHVLNDGDKLELLDFVGGG
ncbi:MAG: thiamine biosynthesis protein ThiS [Epsilonproteobacteria bacterium]|nr:MAG: thiamine biosynthesis protein ThiS [Campylobacterota bacterium]